jgi:hypothetical protein
MSKTDEPVLPVLPVLPDTYWRGVFSDGTKLLVLKAGFNFRECALGMIRASNPGVIIVTEDREPGRPRKTKDGLPTGVGLREKHEHSPHQKKSRSIKRLSGFLNGMAPSSQLPSKSRTLRKGFIRVDGHHRGRHRSNTR